MASPTSPFDVELDLDLDKIYLDIDPALPEQAWQRSRGLATSASQWRAYVNDVAMRSLVSWLQSDAVRVSPAMRAALWPTVWEWVTGSAWEVDGLRWVLLPTEAIDDGELRVPQEWVDIPSWVGDYYLLLQVNLDAGWVKIAGFATHAMVKTQGAYDGRDRAYSLPASDLLTDINVIEISQAMAPDTVKRAAVAPVPELPLAQANQLMARLSRAEQLMPRLAIGFGPWSALLAHGGWRREMTRQRQGSAPSFSVSQWVQQGLSELAGQLGWQAVSLQPVTVGARGDDEATAQAAFTKVMVIESEDYSLQVSPLQLSNGRSDGTSDELPDGTSDSPEPQANAWRFELRKLNGFIPQGVTLRLLTEDLQPFENNEVTAAEPVASLYVDVALAPGEGIVWETSPTPEGDESEILRF